MLNLDDPKSILKAYSKMAKPKMATEVAEWLLFVLGRAVVAWAVEYIVNV